MPKLPKNKAVTDFTDGIYRRFVPYSNIQTFDGNIWRAIVRRQPVIMDCISSLIMYIQGLPFEVRAKDPNKTDELKDEIIRHTDILNNANNGAGFLNYEDLLLQDFFMLPFGGATETVRYSDDSLYSINQIDGATLYPTSNPLTPVVQLAMEVKAEPIYFSNRELVRIYQSPRPELMYRGWGMAPPEKIYLALEMLNRGDKYYADLLLDTPEAGLLDLGDMSKESAEAWLKSFKNMFTGVDGFKIPVLYEHTTPASYIQFHRPPTDLMFDSITMKYAQLICAAFGLTIGDIGLKGSNGSLSDSIRDERHSKSTGKAMVKAYMREHINSFLPDDLRFWFVDTDDELLVSKGRARSANAIAGRNLIESGAITPVEWRKQLQADGLITIPLPEEPDDSEFDILHDISGLNIQIDAQEEQAKLQAKASNAGIARKGGQAGFALNKRRNVRGGKTEAVTGKENVPASQGGQGEIKSLVEESNTTNTNVVKQLLSDAFDDVIEKATDVRLRRVIKSVYKNIEPILKSASQEEDYESWLEEYYKFLFGQENNFGDEMIQRSARDLLNQLFLSDTWYRANFDDTELGDYLSETFATGIKDGARELQEYLYEEGIVDSPDIYGDVELSETNKDEFYKRSLQLLSLVNDGTEFYLKRLASGVIARLIREPNFVEDENIIENSTFLDQATNDVKSAFEQILRVRIDDISSYEIERSYSLGKLKQYSASGLTKKAVVHVGSDTPCENCQEQEALGFVAMDYVYQSKFGETLSAPFHTNCHDVLIFDKQEAKSLTKIKLYNGE